MRTRYVAAVAAMMLLLSATAAAAQTAYDEDDAVDTDTLDFDVDLVCETDPDLLPDGVSGVGRGGDGIYRYIAPITDFDVDEFAHGVYHTPTIEVAFGDTALVVAEGNAYFQLPNNHDWYDIVFVLDNGDTHTAGATFDSEGCIDEFKWEKNAYEPNIEFRDEEGVDQPTGPVDAQVGVPLDLSVHVENNDNPNAYGSSLDNWWIGLEVRDFLVGVNATVEACDEDYTTCAAVEHRTIQDGGTYILQVELTDVAGADALTAGDDATQHFRVTFAQRGQFTGEAFLFGDLELYGADLLQP